MAEKGLCPGCGRIKMLQYNNPGGKGKICRTCYEDKENGSSDFGIKPSDWNSRFFTPKPSGFARRYPS